MTRPISTVTSSAALGRRSISRRSVLRGGLAGAGSLAAASVLGSCSSGSNGSDLEFWQFYAPTTQSEPDLKAQNNWFTKVIDGWNQSNPEQVKPVFIPAYTDPKNTRLATSFASGAGPDIFLDQPR